MNSVRKVSDIGSIGSGSKPVPCYDRICAMNDHVIIIYSISCIIYNTLITCLNKIKTLVSQCR